MVAISKPTVNGSSNTWGSELNTALDTLASAVTTLETGTAAAPVPLSTVTTKGDIIAATGPNAVARVHSAADGYVLTAASATAAGVTFALAPGSIVAKLRQTSAQSIPTGTFTPLVMQTSDVVRLGSFSSGSSYTPGVAGWYELTGGFSITNGASNTGVRACSWWISGTPLPASIVTTVNNGNSLAESLAARTVQVQLSTSDSISLIGYHNFGAALSTFTTSPYGSYIGVKYLGS